MRARTNLSVKDRRQFMLSDLRGCDFSSSPLRAASYRATDMTNFICEYGANRKRPGWRQLFQLPGRINGICQFTDIDGYHTYLIYAGTRFYRTRQWHEGDPPELVGKYSYDDVTHSSTNEWFMVDKALLTDTRVQFFKNKGRIYIVGCGDYLCYADFGNGYELRRMDYYTQYLLLSKFHHPIRYGNLEEMLYIPTTTISIDPIDVADTVRKSRDEVSLLTNWRKNTLVGANSGATWKLDGSPHIRTLWIEVKKSSGEMIRISQESSLGDGADNYQGEELTDVATGEVVGYFDMYKNTITLNIETNPRMEGVDNITVYFADSLYDCEEKRKMIRNARHGTLFGVGGVTDRLFLAGGGEYQNVEFFSEADDFSYFPDRNTATLGTDEEPITGYLRMSDNTLAIFKRYSQNEPSVYYQTGEYRSFYTDAGELEKITPVFSLTAGATGESAVNAYSCANFVGDNMILSRNGVFAIELTENVATNARTARERSRVINARLCEQTGLSDAAGVVWRGKYYLSMDGVCYVADSRYKFTPEDSSSYNYEWWYWDNIPARVWAVVEDALWFGTPDGSVCTFDDLYTDRTYWSTTHGDLGFDFDDNRMVHRSLDTAIEDGDCIKIETNGVFAVLTDSLTVVDGKRIRVSEEEILNIFEGTEVYLDGVGESGLLEGVVYYICDTDRGDCTFALSDAEGAPLELVGVDASFRLLRHISDRELYVADVEESSFRLKLSSDGEVLRLTNYFKLTADGTEEQVVPTNPIASFWRERNVVARWQTPVFDLGSNEVSKTLLKLTISAEPGNGGRLSFSYETRKTARELMAQGLNKFSFENLDFSSFSFDTGFASSYSVKVKERNFNYITFRFESDSDKDCSINDFTVTYKINQRNLGVR